MRRLLIAVLTLICAAAPARAQDYAQPTWPNLSRALVRFNAISLSETTLLDEYAIITECDLYKAFYHDDFKWNQVREAVRKSVADNVATFPMNFYFNVNLQLDRYDFQSKTYKLTEKTALRNVNTFMLYAVEGTGCGAGDVKYLPRRFRAVLETPVYLEGIPLAEPDGAALLKQMNADGNTDHLIYTRLNLRIIYIDALRKKTTEAGTHVNTVYEQSRNIGLETVRLDARLDSVDFFEDAKMTRLIFHYQP